MRDFTITIYQELLHHLAQANYSFQTFSEFLQKPAKRSVMLRHDVDDRKHHSLQFARIQAELGIVGSYYFRMVPQSFDPTVIREIYAMGHEIGYHYEDMDFSKGDPQRAMQLFAQHLAKLRELVPVTSICMHGSPRSPYDNRDIWKHYDYREYDILGEPYFDLNFREVFYLTDTGRRWDGHRVSMRDKVEPHFPHSFRTTAAIIECIKKGEFPHQSMFNFHPQRWMNETIPWAKEKYLQKLKNGVKYYLIQWRKSRSSQHAT